MLHTHENLHNAPPTGRRGLFLCSLPAICRHGLLCVDVILFFASTDGSAGRGDPVGMGVKLGFVGVFVFSAVSFLSLPPRGRGTA